MAVRTPLYYTSGNVKEMSSAMVDQIIDRIIYQYSLSPSVSLNVVASAGSLDSMTDTRKTAGAASTSTTGFPSEATTAEPGTVTITYDKINQSLASISTTSDTGKTWPVYYTSGGHIQAMSLQDIKDTFLHPAIDLLVSGSAGIQQAGTYFISTSSSVGGATLVSGTSVFTDTRANTAAYTAGGIPETLDQPTTISNYYLHRINGFGSAYTAPLYITSGNHLQTYASATFESLIQEWIQYTAASSTDGYRISYNINGSGTNRGSAMINTVLNGSGDYQTLFVNADDYRAQEFPNGTAITANTYYLKINKS